MRGFWLILFAAPSIVFAAEVEPFRDKACPDAWRLTDRAIPVVRSTANPWGQGTDDKDLAETHLSGADPVVTVTAAPVTVEDLVNDPLTVASECLNYRDMMVRGEKIYPQAAPIERNEAAGFIPATIF